MKTISKNAIVIMCFHCFLVICFFQSFSFAQAETTRYDKALELSPVGYWLADDGEGELLRDLSIAKNHGTIYHTPWDKDKGLLDFTSAYQWIEITNKGLYSSKDFSLGFWLFTNRIDYKRDGLLLFGNTRGWWKGEAKEFGIILKEGGKIEVISGGKKDALGSLDNEVITPNKWHHIAYKYTGGKSKLFIDGKLTHKAENVEFEAAENPFLIGNDASWWMLHPPGSSSLNGSIRNLAIFDRDLSEEEIGFLYKNSKPQVVPDTIEDSEVVIDGKGYQVSDLSQLDIENRLLGFIQIDSWSKEKLEEAKDDLLDIIHKDIKRWQTAQICAKLYAKISGSNVDGKQEYVLDYLLNVITDPDKDEKEKAAATAALAELNFSNKQSLDILAGELRKISSEQQASLPRIEQIYKNALIYALLNIAAEQSYCRELLDNVYAKPILETFDITGDNFKKVRILFQRKRYMDALDAYKDMPEEEKSVRFFSQGDPLRDARTKTPNLRAYTPTANYNGYAYKIGKAIAFESADQVSSDQFKKAIAELAPLNPEAKNWRSLNFDKLYRVNIHQTAPDGAQSSALLEGDWFIFDGTDQKMQGWSVGVDKNGYIHIFGGQHNAPNYNNYIPGSWEKLGLSNSKGDENYPALMYWVSRKPSDISKFKFVGRNSDSQKGDLPDYFNYMNFVRDREGELYVYGRTNIAGFQSWGMYRYDANQQRWFAIGGDACDIVADGTAANPNWRKSLIKQFRGTVPSEPGAKSVVWAWQPHFYNYCRASRGWGLHFDLTNRMHLRVPIRGLDKKLRINDNEVYAYSDDGGRTFHRADGSRVNLPLTLNPAPLHNADMAKDNTQQWWDIWIYLLKYAGFKDFE